MQYTAAVQGAAGRLLSGWDGVFVVVFLLAVLITAAVLTRTRLIIALVALYISNAVVLLLLTPEFPRASQWISGIGMNVGVFLTLFIVVSSVLGASVLKTSTRKKADALFSFRLAYAFVLTGFLLSSIVSQLPPEGFQTFAPLVWRLSGSPVARLMWMIVPLFAMLVLRERRRRR